MDHLQKVYKQRKGLFFLLLLRLSIVFLFFLFCLFVCFVHCRLLYLLTQLLACSKIYRTQYPNMQLSLIAFSALASLASATITLTAPSTTFTVSVPTVITYTSEDYVLINTFYGSGTNLAVAGAGAPTLSNDGSSTIDSASASGASSAASSLLSSENSQLSSITSSASAAKASSSSSKEEKSSSEEETSTTTSSEEHHKSTTSKEHHSKTTTSSSSASLAKSVSVSGSVTYVITTKSHIVTASDYYTIYINGTDSSFGAKGTGNSTGSSNATGSSASASSSATSSHAGGAESLKASGLLAAGLVSLFYLL